MGSILKAFLDNGMYPVIYVYRFYKKDFDRNEYKTLEEIEAYVGDSVANQEYWLLKEPKRVSIKKIIIVDAWIRKIKNMFGVTEYFCLNENYKQTKTKKENIDYLLKFFKNHKDSELLTIILKNEQISFRGKMNFLVENHYLEYKED